MPYDPVDLPWEPIISDDRPIDEWAYARAKIPGGWLVRCERGSAPGVSVAMTFVPDPEYTWETDRAPVAERSWRTQEPLPPLPPPTQSTIAGLPLHMRARLNPVPRPR